MRDAVVTSPLFETALTRLLGIDHPILCGGLMWLSTAPYVAAVVNAGGMGFITARSFGEDLAAFRDDLRICRDLTGGRPFGVNLYLPTHAQDDKLTGRYIDVLLDEGVRIVETAGSSPAAILPRLKDGGCIVIHKVSALAHAKSAVRADADAITVIGMECGGHPGLDFIGSMVQGALAPAALGVPVVIGGGIGTGRQIVAALAMGAAGVVLGTRMLVAAEIMAAEAFKRRVVDADERASRLVLACLRNTYRVMDNATARKVAEMEAAGETRYEAFRPLMQGSLQKLAYDNGDIDQGLLSMGQAAVFAERVAPVADIFAELLADAGAAMARLRRLTPPPA